MINLRKKLVIAVLMFSGSALALNGFAHGTERSVLTRLSSLESIAQSQKSQISTLNSGVSKLNSLHLEQAKLILTLQSQMQAQQIAHQEALELIKQKAQQEALDVVSQRVLALEKKGEASTPVKTYFRLYPETLSGTQLPNGTYVIRGNDADREITINLYPGPSEPMSPHCIKEVKQSIADEAGFLVATMISAPVHGSVFIGKPVDCQAE